MGSRVPPAVMRMVSSWRGHAVGWGRGRIEPQGFDDGGEGRRGVRCPACRRRGGLRAGVDEDVAAATAQGLATLAWTAGWFHMTTFMAGAMRTGAFGGEKEGGKEVVGDAVGELCRGSLAVAGNDDKGAGRLGLLRCVRSMSSRVRRLRTRGLRRLTTGW